MNLQALNTLPRDLRNKPFKVTHPFRGKYSNNLSWTQARAKFRYYIKTYGDGYVSLEQEKTILAFYNPYYRQVYVNPFRTEEQWIQAYNDETLAHWKGAVRLQAEIFNHMKTDVWLGVEQELWERYWASSALLFLYSDQEKEEGLYQSETYLWLEAHSAGFGISKWENDAKVDFQRIKNLQREHETDLPSYEDRKARRLALFKLLKEYRGLHPVSWAMPGEIL